METFYLTLSEFDMSFVRLVSDHHGDGLLGIMLLDYKSVKLYRMSWIYGLLRWGFTSHKGW